MTETLLFNALMNAAGLSGAASLAGAASNQGVVKDDKMKVLGGDPTDLLATTKSKELEPSSKETKPLSKDEKDNLYVDLAAAGLSSRDIKLISEGKVINPYKFAALPRYLQNKVARLSGDKVYDMILSGFGGDPEDDNGDKDKKGRKKPTKEKVEELVERAKRAIKREQESIKPSAKDASRAKTNDVARFKKTEVVEKTDPRLKELSPKEKMEQGERLMNEARKNGNLPDWVGHHVQPVVTGVIQ